MLLNSQLLRLMFHHDTSSRCCFLPKRRVMTPRMKEKHVPKSQVQRHCTDCYPQGWTSACKPDGTAMALSHRTDSHEAYSARCAPYVRSSHIAKVAIPAQKLVSICSLPLLRASLTPRGCDDSFAKGNIEFPGTRSGKDGKGRLWWLAKSNLLGSGRM
jgi:hypothetical protein